MHYYQHHIGDFIKDTANLDDHQIATYLRMIWAYYSSESPFEDDCDGIAFAVRSDERTVRLILKHYFSLVDGEWRHSRCDRELMTFRGKSEKAKKSANARWKNANALPPHSERTANERVFDANQEPITNNQERAKKHRSSCAELDESFESFWRVYPKKVGKKDAMKAWSKVKEERREEVMRGLSSHVVCDQWVKDEGRFIPNAATWLNAERWDDQVKAYKATGLGKHSGFSGQRNYEEGLHDNGDGTFGF